MGQAVRSLVPTLSPLHYFGAELRRLRTERGWSQATLASEVITSKDLVRRIETAERFPSSEFISRCDEALECGGYLCRMWPMLERERLLRLDAGGEHKRMVFDGGLCDRPVLDWLVGDEQPRPGWAPDEEDASLGDRLRRLRDLDHRHGGGRYYSQVTHSLGAAQAAAPTVAIGFMELAGYEAVDLGADGPAQRHYLAALDVASSTGDRLYGAYLIGVSLAHLSLHSGDPVQAIRLASAALRGTAAAATPATSAAIRVVLARAHARLGNERQAVAALLEAERDLGRSRIEAEPPFVAYFGEADLADEGAHIFSDLGFERHAQRNARAAIDALEPSRVRRLAIDHALLACSLVRDDAVEEACAVGTQAIDFAAATASFRTMHRIMLMLAHLQQYAAVPTVRDLFDYANVTLPAVPPSLPLGGRSADGIEGSQLESKGLS